MTRQRLEWLDALRGFTMLLVVVNHTYGFGFDTNTKYSMFMSLCLLFRMPLFFFISGFLAYKASFSWSAANTGRLLGKKLRVQIVPTLVFMTAEIALLAKHFWERMGVAWESPTKGGYWFTLVLLEMFIVYYAISFISKRIHYLRGDDENDDRVTTTLLLMTWGVATFAYATLYMPRWFTWRTEPFFRYTSLTEFARFFQFFLLGNICRRYWEQATQLFDSKWFFPLLVAVAFLGAGDYLRWHNLRMEWANLPRTLAMYSLVMLIVCFFRHYASWFTRETRVGTVLQYIGVRTLDIYLIHYFFFPKLPDVGKWFRAHPGNFVLEGTTALAMAALVIAFSILTSHVLRVSPFLKKWLFGRD